MTQAMKKTFLIFYGLSLILAASCSKTPLEKQEDGSVKCSFEKPVRASTPGQAVVFYDGEYVLGGGTII